MSAIQFKITITNDTGKKIFLTIGGEHETCTTNYDVKAYTPMEEDPDTFVLREKLSKRAMRKNMVEYARSFRDEEGTERHMYVMKKGITCVLNQNRLRSIDKKRFSTFVERIIEDVDPYFAKNNTEVKFTFELIETPRAADDVRREIEHKLRDDALMDDAITQARDMNARTYGRAERATDTRSRGATEERERRLHERTMRADTRNAELRTNSRRSHKKKSTRQRSRDVDKFVSIEHARQHEIELKEREMRRVAEVERRMQLVRLGHAIGRGE